LTLTRESFERIYRYEQDVKDKGKNMLLVLNVVYQRVWYSCSYVARDLHRRKAWASNWLKRYDEEGIDGLKDRPKSGRHSQIPDEQIESIK